MHILIDNKSGVPIYDQICSQIKAQIIGGELAAHQPLPSIRGLAKDLRISVITTKRAYDELEREGFLYTVPAKGSFVAPRREVDDGRKEELFKQLDAAVKALLFLGLTKEELIKRVEAQEGGSDHA